MKVRLTYFKAHGGGPSNLGGKYYSEGDFETEHPPEHYWKAIDEAEAMLRERRLPGLVKGHGDFHVLITTEPESVPHLLIAPSFVNPESSNEQGEEKRARKNPRRDPRWFELYKAALVGLCAKSGVSTAATEAAWLADAAHAELTESER